MRPSQSDAPGVWTKALEKFDRATLSRLMSLAESRRPEDRSFVDEVLSGICPRRAFRIALTGPPGVGKSSLLEVVGKRLLAAKLRVAALTIDPSSEVSGGSLLADKTRMPALSTSEYAYVRPMASSGGLGGLAPATSRCLSLCDHAGFDVVFVETVGVGQVEFSVKDLVDWLIMVVTPHLGDDLQGMKRGINEHADMVIVNKSDLHDGAAALTREIFASTLQMTRGLHVPVHTVSSYSESGIDAVIVELEALRTSVELKSGRGDRGQERRFVRLTQQLILDELLDQLSVGGKLTDIVTAVRAGNVTPEIAAEMARARLIQS